MTFQIAPAGRAGTGRHGAGRFVSGRGGQGQAWLRHRETGPGRAKKLGLFFFSSWGFVRQLLPRSLAHPRFFGNLRIRSAALKSVESYSGLYSIETK